MPPRKLRRTPEERALRAARRMVPGSIDGRSDSAAFVRNQVSKRLSPPAAAASGGFPDSLFRAKQASTISNVTADVALDWTLVQSSPDVQLDGTNSWELNILTDGLYAITYHLGVQSLNDTNYGWVHWGIETDQSSRPEHWEWTMIRVEPLWPLQYAGWSQFEIGYALAGDAIGATVFIENINVDIPGTAGSSFPAPPVSIIVRRLGDIA